MTGRVIQGWFLAGHPKLPPPAPARLPPPLIQARGAARPPGPPMPACAGRQGAVQRHGSGAAFAVEAGPLGLAPSHGGRPLPEAVRGKMEAAFGANFSDVRVHVGPQAERIGAIAFTVGSDIYFAPGRFQPDTAHGQQLLGHELAHVVQQRAGRVRNPLGSGLAVVQDHALEAEADRLGQRAASARYRVPTVAAPSAQPVKAPKLAQAKQRLALSALRTIQRDVGFEFQTQYHVERRGNIRRFFLGAEFKKGEPLYARNDWSLTADGAEIEFITDHFPETVPGRNRLTQSLTDLVAFCTDLETRMQAKVLAANIVGAAPVDVTNAELNAAGGGVNPVAPPMGTKLTLSTLANAIPFQARPQATVGVRLDRISNLFQDLGTANSDATKELGAAGNLRALFANAAADAAAVVPANAAPALSDEMKGLLTEILGLIRRAGVVVNNPRAYAKMGALLLNRTNFVAMYRMLSAQEQAFYSANGGQPFVALVRAAENNRLEGAALNMGRQLMRYSVYVDANNPNAGQIQLPLTRDQWLRGITQGRDQLTAARNRNMQKHSDKTHPLREFGLLGLNTDPVNNNADRGVVLEFRDVRQMPKAQWLAFAQDVFDYVMALNQWNGVGAAPTYDAHGRV